MVASLNVSLAQIFLKRQWVIYETWSENLFHFPSRIKHINVKRKEYNFNFLIGIWHLLFSMVYFIFYNYQDVWLLPLAGQVNLGNSPLFSAVLKQYLKSDCQLSYKLLRLGGCFQCPWVVPVVWLIVMSRFFLLFFRNDLSASLKSFFKNVYKSGLINDTPRRRKSKIIIDISLIKEKSMYNWKRLIYQVSHEPANSTSIIENMNKARNWVWDAWKVLVEEEKSRLTRCCLLICWTCRWIVMNIWT